MTRQYVGARYVPRFYEGSDGANWTANTQYEPLTIVARNGNSYTSKKPVPASIGAPESNPEYWVCTGIYNQQVEDLRQQVDNISDDLTGYSERLTGAESDIESLQQTDSRLLNRKVIFISDSFCSGNIGGSGLANGIFTTFCNNAGLTPNDNAKLYYQGGSGFIVHPNGKTFRNLAEDAVSEAFFPAEDVTDIMVVTAGNDGGQAMNVVQTAWVGVRNYLHTHFPNARIFIAVVGGSTDGATRNQIRNVIQVACYYNAVNYVIPVYNGMLPLWFFDSFSDDGIHPVLKGCERIGYMLARAFVEKTSYPRLNDFNFNANLDGIDGEVTTGAQFYISPSIDSLRIRCTNSPTLAVAAQATYNQGCLVKIGKVTNLKSFLVPNATSTNNVFYHLPAEIYVYKTSNSWVHIFGEIVIVKDTASAANVYFKASTAPENISGTNVRMSSDTIATLTACGYI